MEKFKTLKKPHQCLTFFDFSGQNFAYIIRILQEYLYNFNRNSNQKCRWLQLIIVINLTKYAFRRLSLLESGSWDSGKTPFEFWLQFLRNLVPIRILYNSNGNSNENSNQKSRWLQLIIVKYSDGWVYWSCFICHIRFMQSSIAIWGNYGWHC